MVWKFRPKFRPNSDLSKPYKHRGFVENGLKIQTKIQAKFRPKFRPWSENSDQKSDQYSDQIQTKIQTKFRPKFRPWPDSCQCAELVLIVCWAHQVFQEWQAQRPKGFGQPILVTQGKGRFRLLRAMQLKIAQKVLNLSFKDKSWMKLKFTPKSSTFSKILYNFSFQKFRGSSKYFEDFDPQNILRKNPPNIKYWGLGLQGMCELTDLLLPKWCTKLHFADGTSPRFSLSTPAKLPSNIESRRCRGRQLQAQGSRRCLEGLEP